MQELPSGIKLVMVNRSSDQNDYFDFGKFTINAGSNG